MNNYAYPHSYPYSYPFNKEAFDEYCRMYGMHSMYSDPFAQFPYSTQWGANEYTSQMSNTGRVRYALLLEDGDDTGVISAHIGEMSALNFTGFRKHYKACKLCVTESGPNGLGKGLTYIMWDNKYSLNHADAMEYMSSLCTRDSTLNASCVADMLNTVIKACDAASITLTAKITGRGGSKPVELDRKIDSKEVVDAIDKPAEVNLCIQSRKSEPMSFCIYGGHNDMGEITNAIEHYKSIGGDAGSITIGINNVYAFLRDAVNGSIKPPRMDAVGMEVLVEYEFGNTDRFPAEPNGMMSLRNDQKITSVELYVTNGPSGDCDEGRFFIYDTDVSSGRCARFSADTAMEYMDYCGGDSSILPDMFRVIHEAIVSNNERVELERNRKEFANNLFGGK